MTTTKSPLAIYRARQRLLAGRGQWEPWSPAAPARDHARHVLAVTPGLTRSGYASIAGIDRSTLNRLLDRPPGDPDVIYTTTARAVLAVTPGSVPSRAHLVDATGSCRRLRALACLGWSVPQLAARTGVAVVNLQQVRAGLQARVEQGTAAKISAAYGELWLTPAPEASMGQKQSAAKSRIHAARQQWVSGSAWDDIDDPACRPHGARRLKAG